MEEFYSIVPRQPYRPEDTPSEVRLEFEAVLLDGSTDNPTKNQLWIHARIKACVNGADCVPVSFSGFCFRRKIYFSYNNM